MRHVTVWDRIGHIRMPQLTVWLMSHLFWDLLRIVDAHSQAVMTEALDALAIG